MDFVGLHLLLSFVLSCVPTSKGSHKERPKKFMKPCFDEDELLNLCTDPIEICHEERADEIKLVRLDGVKTGHMRWVELEEGRKYKMITRAMKPLLFEIPEFLSDEESEHIISLAKDSGLTMSIAGFDMAAYEGDLDEDLAEADGNWTLDHEERFAKGFSVWDVNGDDFIDANEVRHFAQKRKLLFMKEDEVPAMFERIGLSYSLQDGKISRKVFAKLNVKKILWYMDFLKEKSPRHRPRYSQQAWLRQDKAADPILRRLLKRITKLTQLPSKVIEGSEWMQVVQYGPFGHYHGHLDSNPFEDPTIPCCHQNHFGKPECRVCRLITILYYLNNVEEGGETAFLIADNTTITPQELEDPNATTDEFNLSVNCHLANLVIPPKKGKAIMWYNNYIDPDSGLLGSVDRYSLHGGCDIIKGEKWIANNWITAPTKYSRHIKSLYDQYN
ncbi:transmembrane prolyl 4-hydroxylase-like [Acropora muricata]|uniref:transmembrane prolyl 4-hydroxylase-like n=1 Tax=Acropora muricata TaxID=159855 RepID=UPI0034E53B4D